MTGHSPVSGLSGSDSSPIVIGDLRNSEGYLAPLDGIRALAVALVVAAHYKVNAGVGVGSFGVTVFFFLSGFLISRLLFVESTASGGRIRIGAFYGRRFLRLLPALLLFVGIYSFVSAFYLGDPPRSGEVAAGLFYFENYYWLWLDKVAQGASMHWGILWSLAVEEHFYLLFPVFFSLFHANRARFLQLVLVACGTVLVWRAVGILSGLINARWTYLATDSRVDSILYGVALAAAIEVPALHDRLRSLMRYSGVAAVSAFAALALGQWNEPLRPIIGYSIQGMGLWLLFLLVCFDAKGISKWFRAVLTTPILRYVGRISYGIYLWHGACYAIVGHWLGGKSRVPSVLLLGAIALMLTLAVTSASYFLVERRFLGLRRHFAPAHKIGRV